MSVQLVRDWQAMLEVHSVIEFAARHFGAIAEGRMASLVYPDFRKIRGFFFAFEGAVKARGFRGLIGFQLSPEERMFPIFWPICDCSMATFLQFVSLAAST